MAGRMGEMAMDWQHLTRERDALEAEKAILRGALEDIRREAAEALGPVDLNLYKPALEEIERIASEALEAEDA